MKYLFLVSLILGQDEAQSKSLRDYALGESAQRPSLQGLDWQQVRKALEGFKFPPAEKPGKETSHSHTLANGHEATFYYYVPESYDPAKRAPLAIFLHGGVSDRQPKRGKNQWQVWKAEADKNGWIACSPSGTDQCLWWKPSGEEHILEMVRYISARYNVDRNRVYLSGFSDGSSGTLCLGMRLTDLWAACVAWNGAIGVVTSPRAGNTPFYTANCKGTAWRCTHGSKDQLYPSASQKGAMDRLKEAGVALEWKSFEGVGHEGGKILQGDREFIDEWLPKRARDPLPKEIDWTTHDPERYGQAFWIRVVALGERPANPFKDEKDFTFPVGESGPPRPVLGVQIDQKFEGPGVRIDQVTDGSGAKEAGVKDGDVITSAGGTEINSFDDLRGVLGKLKNGDKVKLALKRGEEKIELEVTMRPVESRPDPGEKAPGNPGRLRATRDGNRVNVLARGVAKFEILVSPDAFDLSKEIAVTVNGKEAFKGIAAPDAAILLDEVRRRHGDASVAYVARIAVDVPGEREY